MSSKLETTTGIHPTNFPFHPFRDHRRFSPLEKAKPLPSLLLSFFPSFVASTVDIYILCCSSLLQAVTRASRSLDASRDIRSETRERNSYATRVISLFSFPSLLPFSPSSYLVTRKKNPWQIGPRDGTRSFSCFVSR